jgi:Na+/pantothenate symporter
VFTAGLTLPIIFGFYKEKTRVTCKGAFWSLIFGGGISLVWLNIVAKPYSEYAVLVGLLCSLIPLVFLRSKRN